mgnify:CR=1 FL=1
MKTSQTKRESGINGVSGGRAPANLTRAKVTNRNPYGKVKVSAKEGGRSKNSKSA